MPTMANITVKNAGNVDHVFTALSASAGDRVAAVWRYDGDATIPLGMRPIARMTTQDNGPKTARRMVMDANWPVTYTDTTTSQKVVLARIPVHLEVTLPANIVASDLANYSFILLNLLSAQLVKDSAAAGYAPT